MSFAAELKDFAAGFNAGLSASRKVRGIMEEREFEDEKKRAEEAVDTRRAEDADMPVRRASTRPPGADRPPGNDKDSGYSSSSYGGDPYTGDDSDIANYLADEDKELAPILKVAMKDSGYNWNALTYKKDRSPGGEADLENMTIAQVYDLQERMRGTHASTAVGGFQTIHETLKRAVDSLGLDPAKTRFDRSTQSKIAAYLARTDGGYNDYKAGKLDEKGLAAKLAGVWAVLPKDASGRGRYDGFNGNRAGVSYSTVSEAIRTTSPRDAARTTTASAQAIPLQDPLDTDEDEEDDDAY